MSGERDFLRRRAAASGITVDVAAAAVEECTGRAPRFVAQFDGGWGAVPFWATAADGTELVVRVAFGERGYRDELAVLERVRAAGIPAPRALGVCRVGDRLVSVLHRDDGVSLQDLLLLRGAGDPQLQRVCTEAGRLLARVHAIDPGGLSLRRSETVDDVRALVERLASVLPAGHATLMVRAFDRLDVLRDPVPVALAHSDFGADHVLVADGRITAIIDWERAALADPARDVAWWRLYDSVMGGGADAVRAGYGARPDDFDARVRAWVFAECICAVHFDVAEGNDDGTAGMLALTEELLGRV